MLSRENSRPEKFSSKASSLEWFVAIFLGIVTVVIALLFFYPLYVDYLPTTRARNAKKDRDIRALRAWEGATNNARVLAVDAVDEDAHGHTTGVENEFMQALALNPNSAYVHLMYANFLSRHARDAAAYNEYKIGLFETRVTAQTFADPRYIVLKGGDKWARTPDAFLRFAALCDRLGKTQEAREAREHARKDAKSQGAK